MKKYYFWVTLLLETYADQIVTALVRNGYGIRPAAKDGELICKSENNAYALMAFELTTCKAVNDKLFKEISSIISENSQYFSIICQLHNGHHKWNVGNITLSLKEPLTHSPYRNVS